MILDAGEEHLCITDFFLKELFFSPEREIY